MLLNNSENNSILSKMSSTLDNIKTFKYPLQSQTLLN